MGNTKMKLINLAKIFLTLVVAINLLATCEAKKVKKHSVLIPRKDLYILAGEGEVCSKSTPNFPPTKCAHPFVCKPMASDMNRGMTGMSSYCQRATGLIKPTVIDNVIPIPKPSIRIVKEGKVCYRSTPNFPISICEKGLECKVRPGTQLGMTGGAKICQKPTKVWSHTGGNQIIKPVIMTGGHGRGLPPAPTTYHYISKTITTKPIEHVTLGGDASSLPPRRAFLGDVCFKPTPDFPRTMCERGLECRENDYRGHKGMSKFCHLAVVIAKLGEVCRKPIPNFPKTKCASGLECRVRDSTPRGMTGVSAICQKPKTLHYFSQTITRKPIEPIMLGGNGRGINPNLGQFQKNLVI